MIDSRSYALLITVDKPNVIRKWEYGTLSELEKRAEYVTEKWGAKCSIFENN